MLNEIWRDVPHYDGLYKISNYGRVKSFCKGDEQYKVQHDNGRGYMTVQLYKNGKMKNEYVHRLVALAFIPNPNGLPQVNHKDEDKQNNYVDNLEWCDATYNNNYGTHTQRVVETHRDKGTYEQARERWFSTNPSKTNPKTRGKNAYAKKVMCENHIFDCIKDCADYYNVNYGSMRGWLCGAYKMPRYFVDAGLRYL